MILTLRSDKPEAEIGLYDGQTQVAYVVWEAHRALAETLHQQLAQLLEGQGMDWADVTGIAVYQGPGSFTGLRIGLSVANALAYSYNLPMAGATGENWRETAIAALMSGGATRSVLPEYGAPVHITPQKK